MEESLVSGRASWIRGLFATVFATFMLIVGSPVLAEIVTIEKEYCYEAGEADSKLSCRTIALEQVKRSLLEELGAYLESETEVSNFRLAKEKVVMLTAGIVKVNILEEQWDGHSYRLKAAVTADTDEVARSIEALHQDRQKAKELEETRKLADQLLDEVKRLKADLQASKTVATEKEQQDYGDKVRRLEAINAFEQGYAANLSKDYDLAITCFNRTTEIYPDFPAAYINRGNAYLGKGYYDQAIGDYSTAILLSPLYAAAYYNRAIAYTYRGDKLRAGADYAKAAGIDNRYAQMNPGTGITAYGPATSRPRVNPSSSAQARARASTTAPIVRSTVPPPNQFVRPPVVPYSPARSGYTSAPPYGGVLRYTPGNGAIYARPAQPRPYAQGPRLYSLYYGGLLARGSVYPGYSRFGR